MQKLLRRSALVHRQAERRLKLKQQKKERDEELVRRRDEKAVKTEIAAGVRAEKKNRREDWLLGGLAPNRATGDDADRFGTVDVSRLRGVPLPKKHQKKSPIVEGDRVVVVQAGHKDQGKIGKVIELKEDHSEIVVEGTNMVDVHVPHYLTVSDPDKTPYRAYPLPLPLSAVRLVAALPHPETGAVRDVIINELALRRKTQDQLRGKERPERVIAGVVPRIAIPYPEEKKPEYQDNDGDTLRIEVEDRTWTPTLGQPPMPASILNELRNPYSKFRTRHDEAWLQAKRDEDRRSARRSHAMALARRTPVQEFNRAERRRARLEREAANRQNGGQPLSEDFLASLGRLAMENMAARRKWEGDVPVATQPPSEPRQPHV